MKIHENIISVVGHIPLVRLGRMVDSTMGTVLAKIENINPAGSIKDRIAVHMIKRAEEQGILKPGSTIVESTSGNTGLGLAMTAAVKGYRCVFTMPDKMSKEKIDMLKAFGAEVVVTPTNVAHDSPEGYVEVARRIARETPNAYYIDQYSNPANPEAHYLTTGPEIWEDTDGKIDYFVVGAGTGGTVSGAGKYLKEQAQKVGRTVKVVVPDPVGSMYYDTFYKNSPIETAVYKVEGVGHDFMVDTLDMSVIDEIRQVTDKESFHAARRFCREEGIFTGGSAGTAIHVAVQLAKEVGPGKIIVVIIPDSGDRYVSKFYNDEWMRDLGYLEPNERLGAVKDVLGCKGTSVEFAEPDEALSHVVARMNDLGISQMPLRVKKGQPHQMIDEVDILQSLISKRAKPEDPVRTVATPLQGMVKLEDSISKLKMIFDQNNVAVVVENHEVVGIISKIDMVRYLTAKS